MHGLLVGEILSGKYINIKSNNECEAYTLKYTRNVSC